MNRIRTLLKNNRQVFLVLYLPVYLIWFHWLETRPVSHYHIVGNELDYLIPFCEYFIIPYLLWFAYVGIVVVMVGLHDAQTAWKMGGFLIAGMTFFLVLNTFFPTIQYLRVFYVDRGNVFCELVEYLYGTDTNTNVLPSLHVFNALGCHIALCKASFMKQHPWSKRGSFVLMLLIMLSTMLLKQHSIEDVFMALILGAICYAVFYQIIPARISVRRHSGAYVTLH